MCPQAQLEAEIREKEIAAHQEGVKEKIAANLEHLAQEKVLITSGQQLLANMTSDIAKQLSECGPVAVCVQRSCVDWLQRLLVACWDHKRNT